MDQLLKFPCMFFISDSVLLECGNAAARKSYRSDVVELRKDLQSADRILVPSENDLDFAWNAYERRVNAGAGIVDQLSFVLMRKFEISEVFSNDEHFSAAGFRTLF